MAARNRLRGALAGVSEGIGDVFKMKLGELMDSQARGEADTIQRRRTAQEKVSAGDWTVEQANAYLQGGAIEPSTEQRLSGLTKATIDAPTTQGVPSREAAAQVFRAQRVPTIGFGVTRRVPALAGDASSYAGAPNASAPPTLPSTQYGPTDSPEFAAFNKMRTAKLRSFEPQEIGSGMRGAGSDLQPEKIYGQYNPDTQQYDETQRMATGPTAGQTASSELTKILGSTLSPEATAATITQKNATEAGTRAEAVKTAEAETAAREKAQTEALLARYGGVLPEYRSAAMQLAGAYQQESRPFYVVEQQYRNLTEILNNPVLDPDAQGGRDLAIIYAFMKINSPESTVMQGEVDLATHTAGMPSWLLNLRDSVLGGAKLDDQTRAELMNQATNIYRSGRTQHDERGRRYATAAATMAPGIPTEVIVRPPAADLANQSLSVAERLRMRMRRTGATP